jgi:hypothetical protein
MSKSILSYHGIPLSIGKIPIYYEYVPPVDYGPLLLEFLTNDLGGSSFDPTMIVSGGGVLHWDLGDGSTYDSNAFTHIYSLAGDKLVKVYTGSTAGSSAITSVIMDSDKLVGTIDLSSLTNLSEVYLQQNASINHVINPVSSQIFTFYGAYNCGLTGTLDVSGLTNLGGGFWVNNNPNLTQILNPISSQTFDNYLVNSCNLSSLDLRGLTGLGGVIWLMNNYNLSSINLPSSPTIIDQFYAYNTNISTLDCSGLTGLGGYFGVYDCANLTKITNPVSSQIFQYYRVTNCSLNGTLDVSGLTNLGGSFQAYTNINLREILLPTVNKDFTIFDAHDCSLSQTSVNAVFSKLNTWYAGNPPDVSLRINLHGGGTSWPTNSWSNTNLVNIQGIFFDNSAGGTVMVDISINVEPTPPVETPILIFLTEASTNGFDPVFTVLEP